MKNLMLKEFIFYNSPCINCKSHINIEVWTRSIKLGTSRQFNKIRANININFSEFDLKISYNDYLNLRILHATNIFETNNIVGLQKYFNDNEVVLVSVCSKIDCGCRIRSSLVAPDFRTFRLKPILLNKEFLFISDDEGNIFTVESCADTNKTKVQVYSNKLETSASDIMSFDMPAYPLYKMKSKEAFIKKMKTYMLFS